MTRHAAAGSQKPHKRKKSGASYGSIDFDAVNARKRRAEDVRTWDVSTSGAGRVSAKRKNRQHLHSRPQEHSYQEPALEESVTPGDSQPDDTSPTTSLMKGKRAKRENDSTRMLDWLNQRSVMLDELLRMDGLGGLTTLGKCAGCMERVGEYRCEECIGGNLFCSACIVSSHCQLPLHRLQVWANGFFKRVTLESLGLVVNFGHSGNFCVSPAEPQRILVVDLSGHHTVCVRFCKCSESGFLENFRQILRVGWFPASVLRPQTAFTFDLLDTYHKISHQGKLNLYDFYNAIMQKTDNHGGSKPRYRYHEMSRCVRQWRHLKDLKRGAAGHTTTQVEKLGDGALAVECPACPHPDRNLPIGWENEPGARAWLYCLFLAIDANFRLKLKARGIKDPELGSGLAYFVDTAKFQQHLKHYADEQEIETCGAEFHAVNQANSRSSKDFLVSGVGAVVCRHGLVRKNGVVDLQKGERFVNMDYIFLSTVKEERVKMIKVSYDIACRWSINLYQRTERYSEELHLPKDRFSLEYFIPKFHLPAHGPSCHTRYSFNYRPGVGRTHGENIESGWAHTNPAAVATREMGPGARHSALDGHWGGWNWRKVVGFGTLLLKNLHEARQMSERCEEICCEFERQTSVETVKEWREMKRSWERDPSKADPYKVVEKPASIDAVKRKLAEAEALEVATGGQIPHKLHPSSFVRMGLEIEDQQLQIIEHLRSNRQRTDPQKIEIQQRRNILARRIKAWRVAQAVYMPQAVTYLADGDSSPTSDDAQTSDLSKPETWPLLLPSAIPQDDRLLCYKGVVATEVLLRSAQLQDNLIDLRQSRRALRNLKLHFKTNVAGEGIKTQTKTRTIETSITSRINRAVRRYRTAYEALLQLDPSGDWTSEFRELRNEDNRGPLKEVGELGVGDGRYAPSWIWTTPAAPALPGEGSDAERQEVDETIRREWMTCRARADRWEEEKELLQEEMRRVVAYLEWKSCMWAGKVGVRRDCTPDIQCGIDSYARKQAYVYHELAVSFVSKWFPYFNACGFNLGWTEDFPWASQVPPYWKKLPKWFPAPSRDADVDNTKKYHDEHFDRDDHEGSDDEDSDEGPNDGGWDGEDSDWEGDDSDKTDDGLGFEYDDEYMS